MKQLEPSMDGGLGNTSVPGQAADTPMGALGRLALQSGIDHFSYPLVIIGARTTGALFVMESFHALIVKAAAPFAHRHVAHPQSLANLQVGLSFRTGQNDLGTTHQAVG